MTDLQVYDSNAAVAPQLDLMQDQTIQAILRIADIMAQAKVTVPKHLVGCKADCFAIALQAAAWRMSPFIVAQKTHIVNGFLGYEAQLVNAVILSSRLISGRFKYQWDGNGGTRKCRVGAVIAGEEEITWGTWTEYAKQKVKNSPLWQTDPDQQLSYLAVKKWARLYCPDLIAGVYTPDEVEQFDEAAGSSVSASLDEQPVNRSLKSALGDTEEVEVVQEEVVYDYAREHRSMTDDAQPQHRQGFTMKL